MRCYAPASMVKVCRVKSIKHSNLWTKLVCSSLADNLSKIHQRHSSCRASALPMHRRHLNTQEVLHFASYSAAVTCFTGRFYFHFKIPPQLCHNLGAIQLLKNQPADNLQDGKLRVSFGCSSMLHCTLTDAKSRTTTQAEFGEGDEGAPVATASDATASTVTVSSGTSSTTTTETTA